MVINLMLT